MRPNFGEIFHSKATVWKRNSYSWQMFTILSMQWMILSNDTRSWMFQMKNDIAWSANSNKRFIQSMTFLRYELRRGISYDNSLKSITINGIIITGIIKVIVKVIVKLAKFLSKYLWNYQNCQQKNKYSHFNWICYDSCCFSSCFFFCFFCSFLGLILRVVFQHTNCLHHVSRWYTTYFILSSTFLWYQIN